MALQLEEFLITGRTFEEYAAFFDLNIDALKGKKVLDCPSGVSGFVAEATCRGIDAFGCDLIYRYNLKAITQQASATIEKIYEDTSWMEDHNFSFYGSIKNHRNHREGALKKFINHFKEERYAPRQLPHLSYGNKEFDLILSSHLLFVYDDRLDVQFHIDAVTEMLRVAREVRIFPLIDYKNSRKDEANNLSLFVYEIKKIFDARICPVDFEFQKGGGYMMRLY